MKKFFIFLFALSASCYMHAVEGCMSGLFSVSATKQVAFSMGNLQYLSTQGKHKTADSTAIGTWRFAEHQYDAMKENNAGEVGVTYDKWIDLFGFGTSGYKGVNPYDTIQDNNHYPNTSLVGENVNYDWGVYNAISNGGNSVGQWRTLTSAEWKYLLQERSEASQRCVYDTIKINETEYYGYVLLPDTYNVATSPLTSKSLDSAQWADLEKKGAVFLPMGGYRSGIHVYNEAYTTYPHCGFYWTSTGGVSRIHLVNDKTEIAGTTRKTGCSVRLVQEIIKEALVTVEFPKPGESVISNNHYDANIVGKVTLPEDAKFTVYEMRYYSKDGNTFPERQFNAKTEYKLLIQLKANGTYTFPLLSNGYIDRKAVTAKINDQVITTSNMNVSDKYLTLKIIFTTADDESFVSSPTFSNNASYIVGSAKIGLTCGTAGASIYYTTDGTTPDAANGTLYSDSILVNVDKENDNTQFVIKAVAIKGEISSEVVTKSYKLSRPTYLIMPQTAENGTFTVSLDRAKEDDTITIHATPNTGYIVDKYVIEGVEQDDSTFLMPAKVTRVSVTFKEKEVDIPVITPNSEKIVNTASISITCATEGAKIYYTTDGSTPTDTTATLYNSPISIIVDDDNKGDTLTIKAIAYYNSKSSQVAVQSYVLSKQVEITVSTPSIQPTRDSIIDQAQVTITCATEDATIYYTTNGTTPTDESTRYEGSFTITVNEQNNGTTLTIKAIAYYSGKSSDVATKSYILDRSDKTALQQPTLQNTGTKKVIIGGQLYIQKGGELINVFGVKVER